MKLNSANLSVIPQNIRTPKYDRKQLTASIVHIGVGGFHRAHQCLYLDEVADNLGDLSWGLCGVGLLPHDIKMRDALKSAVDRVKELHEMINGPYDNQVCAHCTWNEDIYVEFPCETLVALDKQ